MITSGGRLPEARWRGAHTLLLWDAGDDLRPVRALVDCFQGGDGLARVLLRNLRQLFPVVCHDDCIVAGPADLVADILQLDQRTVVA